VALPKVEAFHRSPAKVRLLIGSNQAGKSLAADIESAWMLTGKHPFRTDLPKENGTFYFVGWKREHISNLMWPRLSREGAFDIIRDEHTRQWRIYNPTMEYDLAYTEKRRPAAPLIPKRLIASESYLSRKDNLIRRVTTTCGNQGIFFSSQEHPQQGTQIHGWRIDEDVENNLWVAELLARSLKNNAPGIWSATPECGSFHLYNLFKIATRPFGDGRYFQQQLLIEDNPFITAEAKRQFFDSLTEEQRRVKYYGEFAVKGQLVYADFSRAVHCIKPFPIPPTWARFMIVDPGVTPLAVLFAAVNPDPLEVHFYDEIYIKQGSATRFAEEVRAKMGDYTKSFRAFLIDNQMGRQSDVGHGRTVREQYSEALAALGIESAMTGSDFIEGSTDKRGREEALRGWLQVNPASGRPYLRVHGEKCPMFIWEVENQLFRKVDGVVDHSARKRMASHLIDCFDSETEVLSESGWVRFDALPRTERVATVNLETNQIEYQFPTKYVERKHSGDMVRFGGHKLDALVTPNHRMVINTHAYPDPRIVLARDLKPSHRIKLTADWAGRKRETFLVERCPRSQGGDKIVDAGDFAEFLGWYVAEGSSTKRPRCPGWGYRVSVSQTKPKGKERLRELLGRLPWIWHESATDFVCSAKALWSVVRPLGDKYSKFVPDWIRWSDKGTIQRFLDGAIAGDGTYKPDGGAFYYSVSKRLADEIQELFIKVGRNASVTPKENPVSVIRGCPVIPTKPLQIVSEWTLPIAGLRDKTGKPNFETVQYEGMVYCVTVPNGTLIVRRNGRPLIAGNCAEYLSAFDPQYAPPPPPVDRSFDFIQRYLDNEKKRHKPAEFVSLGPAS
jgi:hypothetical protein